MADQDIGSQPQDDSPELPSDENPDAILMEQAPWAGEQQIITAEQTEAHLKNLNKQKEQAQVDREAAAKAAEREAQKRAEQALAAQEAAAKAKAEAERITQLELQKQKEAGIECDVNQCLHDGNCWALPENAYCSPSDPKNAWICKEGFTDTGKACIPQEAEKPAAKKASQGTKAGNIVSQWYFNPYNEGYSNGWGGGHCTHYAGYYWWKEYGISTNWRGNAWAWYKNASAAGWAVGQTPEIGSIVVMKNGVGGRSSYGHVGVVISIDWDNGEMLIEDMNYVGRYIVSQHWVDMYSDKNPIIGYIYPRGQ